jgi:hypothetical protein
MSSVSDQLDAAAGAKNSIWVEIPTGYFALPLDDIAETMARSEAVLAEFVSAELKPALGPVVGVLTVFLEQLVARGVLYCGIGHHLSAIDGSVVTSSLTVSVQRFGADKRNPRLVLKDLLRAKADAGEHGQADLVDVVGRRVLFFERTLDLPTPQLPGQPEVRAGSITPVFQLQAIVPAADGTAVVVIDFSTPMEAQGPQFREMLVLMAASVSFEPPAEDTPSISSRLDG